MREARVLMDRDGDSLKTFDPGPVRKGKKKPPSLSLPRDCEKRRSPTSTSARGYAKRVRPQEGIKKIIVMQHGDYF